MNSSKVEIRRATARDIDAIMRIAEAAKLKNADYSAARNTGFLVSGFTKTRYREFLRQFDHFYVACASSGEVLAFLLAYTANQVTSDMWMESLAKMLYADQFTVIKQICVAKAHAGKGIGSRLYDHIKRQFPDVPIMVSLVVDPPNDASIGFHRKQGFKQHYVATPTDGIPRGWWVLSPPNTECLHTLQITLEDTVTEIVKEQISHAAKLYRHEDNLNWRKLNALLVGTAFLMSFLGYLNKNPQLQHVQAFLIGTFAIGHVMFFAMTRSLWHGVKYLYHYKYLVIDLEEALCQRGAVRVVATPGYRKTTTPYLLRFTPIVIWFIWAVATVIYCTVGFSTPGP